MNRLETELIKVLAIDPYPVVAKGIVSFLLTEQKLFVVDTAFNSHEALKLTRDWKPNIIILDVNLPDTNWTQLATKLRQELVHVKIIAFSDQILDGKKGFKIQDIDGYLFKDCSQNEMIEAIINVYHGKYFCPRQVNSGSMDTNIQKPENTKNTNLLTQREAEVLKLMSEGLQNKGIAARLRIKVRTVEFHVSNILSKLGVASRMEAVLSYKNQIEPLSPVTKTDNSYKASSIENQ